MHVHSASCKTANLLVIKPRVRTYICMVRTRASATAIWIKNSCVHMQSPSEVLNKAMQMAREYPCSCKSKAASSLQKRMLQQSAGRWPVQPTGH